MIKMVSSIQKFPEVKTIIIFNPPLSIHPVSPIKPPLYFELAWDPSAAQVTKKLLPPFTCTWTILPGNWIFATQVSLLNLESQNQAKSIPVGLPSSPTKIWGKSVQVFPSYDRTNKQTDTQTRLQFYIYRDFSLIAFLGKSSGVNLTPSFKSLRPGY